MSTKSSACPTSMALSRAFALGADDALRAHLDACSSCAAAWAGLTQLVELGRALPDGCPSAERRDQVRTELLAAAPRPAPRAFLGRRVLLAGAVALLLGAIVALGVTLVGGSGPARTADRQPTARRAGIHPQEDAVFALVGSPPDEIVRLARGTVAFEVPPLRPGERFRVITADAEVEVRGTVFEVVAEHDRLSAVRVFRGRVEVRPAGVVQAVLGPGQRWDARTVAARAPSAVAAESAPPDEPSPVAPPTAASVVPAILPPAPVGAVAASIPPAAVSRLAEAPLAARAAGPTVTAQPDAPAEAVAGTSRTPTPAELAFDQGWAALRSGNFAPAVREFRHAVVAAGPDALAEDASFWLAVALGRAGSDGEARVALVDFLDRYPASPRAGEASAMLGWILLAEGDVINATARFRASAQDAVPAVRESARRGLATVEAASGTR